MEPRETASLGVVDALLDELGPYLVARSGRRAGLAGGFGLGREEAQIAALGEGFEGGGESRYRPGT